MLEVLYSIYFKGNSTSSLVRVAMMTLRVQICSNQILEALKRVGLRF